MWEMMGYYVGDGWLLDTPKKDGRPCYKIEFIMNTQDFPMIRKTLPVYLSKDKGSCYEYQCRDELWFFILKHFGKYAHGKRIPEFPSQLGSKVY